MAKYLFVDFDNGDLSQEIVIDDGDREAVVNEGLVILRFEVNRFERLVVEEVEDDDGDVGYDDSWELL